MLTVVLQQIMTAVVAYIMLLYRDEFQKQNYIWLSLCLLAVLGLPDIVIKMYSRHFVFPTVY